MRLIGRRRIDIESKKELIRIVCKHRLTVAGDDLRAHQRVRLVHLPVGAARQPLDGLATRRRRWRRNALGAVAIGADGKAALSARPVNVEQRRVASVAHLPHSLDRPLPDHLRRCNAHAPTHTHRPV